MIFRFLLPLAAGIMIIIPVQAQPDIPWQSGFIESLMESIESQGGRIGRL